MPDEPLIRAATRRDILDFYGTRLPGTVTAWVAEYKGESACLAGIYRTRGSIAIAFCELRDTGAPKLLIYKTALKMFEKIKSAGEPMLATPENPRFLEKLGFRPTKEGLYKWDN